VTSYNAAVADALAPTPLVGVLTCSCAITLADQSFGALCQNGLCSLNAGGPFTVPTTSGDIDAGDGG
jgi:hypothetical protein